MPPSRDRSRENSAWDEYRAWEAIKAEAAGRARDTHRERREQEEAEEDARQEAQLLRASEATETRNERAEDLEAARAEYAEKGIDPEAERMALAARRHQDAALARDEALATAEEDRQLAITSAAHQAIETSEEHAAEVQAASNPDGEQYRAMMAQRSEIAERMREYRAERAADESKIRDDQVTAAASMALQAKEARRMREAEEAAENSKRRAPAQADQKVAKALAALISNKDETVSKRARRKAAQERARRESVPAAEAAEAAVVRAEPARTEGEDRRGERPGGGSGVSRWLKRALGKAA